MKTGGCVLEPVKLGMFFETHCIVRYICYYIIGTSTFFIHIQINRFEQVWIRCSSRT